MKHDLMLWVVGLVWVGFFCWDIGLWFRGGDYGAITFLARWQSLFGAGGLVAWLAQPQSLRWLHPIVRAFFVLPACVGIGCVLFVGYQVLFARRAE